MKKTRIEPTIAGIGSELSAEEIAEYLSANPEFFDGREDLLMSLSIPHRRGASISLVERQVALLRERNRALRGELDRLLEAARENDKIFARCRKLVLSLMDARSGRQMLEQLERCLVREFDCEFYRLFIFADRHVEVSSWVVLETHDTLVEQLGGLASSRNPVLGVLRPNELAQLFGDPAARVASAGVFPIRRRKDIGLLALGSARATQFQSGMGTLFTDFITDTLARAIPQYTYD